MQKTRKAFLAFVTLWEVSPLIPFTILRINKLELSI